MEIWTQTDGTHNIYRDHSTTDYSITHFLIKHYMDPLSSFSSLKATSKKDRMMMIRTSRNIGKTTALRTVLCDFNSNLLLIFLRWLGTNKSKVLIVESCCIKNVMIAVERILTNRTMPFQFNQNREKLLIVSENWRRRNQSKLSEVNDLRQSAAVCVTKTNFISLVSSDEDKGWKFPWNIFSFH